MGSTKNDDHLHMSLPENSADGSIEEKFDIDERSLSFSSSSAVGMDSKFSNIQLPLDEDDHNVNNTTSPLFSVDSLKRLCAALPIPSEYPNVSTSANTAVMSNIRRGSSRDCTSPPNCILSNDQSELSPTKRSIFGTQTKKKYNVRRKEPALTPQSQSKLSQVQKSPLSAMEASIPTPPLFDVPHSPINPAKKTLSTPPRTPGNENPPPLQTVGYQNFLSPKMSPLTPNGWPNNNYVRNLMKISDADESSMESTNTKEYAVQFDPTITRYNNTNNAFDPSTPPTENIKSPRSKSQDRHHHAQALLLSLAFFFIWSPQNLLAPNLTQAAYDFGYYGDENARDLYLGSNLALATSVLSLPFSAFIGFASDVVSSRRILISITTFVGGMAAIATGMATTYPQLIISRFVGGSCMSGSVPVVFSLLSDWFDDKDRNAASSGFTAMMGAGILLGQVYAGCTGPSAGWRHSFYTSGILTMILAVLVFIFIREPVRGGKERVLREMLARGGKYNKKLTWSQFVASMTTHSSNCILMLQGFFCNIPWGVMFVFLNDFLSQEKGLSVPDATFIIAVFGLGCAVGGILGGYLGTLASNADRRYLPLFMSFTTLVGILPFIALLDDQSYDHAGLKPCFYAFMGGCLASMPSVNVRPCIINVNPPEIRGAALTAANLIINAARGAGPSFLTTTLMGAFGVNRASGFNITIIIFWTIASIQLALLAKTLPLDQERMETELADYAMTSMDVGYGSVSIEDSTRDGIESYYGDNTFECDKSLFSIENQASAFDAVAARQSLVFMGESFREIGDGMSFCSQRCGESKQVKQPAFVLESNSLVDYLM